MYRGISLNYLLGRFGNSLYVSKDWHMQTTFSNLKPGYKALVSGSTEGNSFTQA